MTDLVRVQQPTGSHPVIPMKSALAGGAADAKGIHAGTSGTLSRSWEQRQETPARNDISALLLSGGMAFSSPFTGTALSELVRDAIVYVDTSETYGSRYQDPWAVGQYEEMRQNLRRVALLRRRRVSPLSEGEVAELQRLEQRFSSAAEALLRPAMDKLNEALDSLE